MMGKSYQRRHLRAPFRETVLFADGKHVLKARAVNISEGGILIDELPSFPEKDQVPLLVSVPQLPHLKNFSLLKMQTFSKELFKREVIRIKAKMVRRDQLAQNLENLFVSRFGLEFVRITPADQKVLEEFVTASTSNLIYLQTLIDSFNTDDETKLRVRTLARILGYEDVERIAQLRAQVMHDYKSLQWM